MNVTVEFLSGDTLVPITELQASTSHAGDSTYYYVRYNVGYTCGPVQCDDVTIHFDPQPLDPTYGTYRFATYSSWTPPFSGATISGNANAGYTVNLGDLEDGTTGNFHVVWRYQQRGVGADPASFFPDGTVIPATATISSANQETIVSTAELTWRIATPEPQVSITASLVAIPIVACKISLAIHLIVRGVASRGAG